MNIKTNLCFFYTLCITLLALFGSTKSLGQQIDQAQILIDFDECLSNVEGENAIYDEFKGEVSQGASGPSIELIGNRLYRSEPSTNLHSCVMGRDFTPAMCVGASSTCLYEAGSVKSVKFDVKVDVNESKVAILNQLSFYEASPKSFAWLGGTTGTNNYPTRYAVRVLKNDKIIYQRIDIPSTRGFSLEIFDFESNPDFTVEQSAVFNFELLAYCPINNGADISLWDLDNLVISAKSTEKIAHSISGGPFIFCTGDNAADIVTNEEITVEGAGTDSIKWIVADVNGGILATPQHISDVDFNSSGEGICLIYQINFSGSLSGLFEGGNLNNLSGNYSLSNSIQVTRNEVNGGSINSGPFNFCVGDGLIDLLLFSEIDLRGNKGASSQWVLTDTSGKILSLPVSLSDVNFDQIEEGICLLWHLSHNDDVSGLAIGKNIQNDLNGCVDLSNSATINRNHPNGGVLDGGPFEFCIGDGSDDFLLENDITLKQDNGSFSKWLITDSDGMILSIPESFSSTNFENTSQGTCLIYHLSHEEGLTGLDVARNINTDLNGCFSLSNAIEVVRTTPSGGTLSGGPFSFCIDGLADTIAAEAITLTGNMGATNKWIIADTSGNILGTPPHFSNVNFDVAGVGTCLIYNISFDGEIQGDTMNGHIDNITGCFGISNAIEVVRSTPSGGTLSGGPFSFCIDGLADTIAADAITLTGNMGATNKWIIADTIGNILGTPPHFSNVNFDVAGVGTCLIYNISFDGEIQGDSMNGHIDNITGCFGISNAIAVVRSTPSGGTLSGGAFSFCIDGLADTIAADAITLTGNMGATNKWIIADTSGNILGTPPHFSNVNFDAAGVGTCLIYNISFDGEIQGDSMNGHIDNITGCFGISNAIAVVRSTPSGGSLSGGPFSFCIDGLADTIAADAITLTGNMGATNKWIIADTSGNILGTPPHFSNVNFDVAGVGTCLIYNISFDGEIQGDSMNGHIDNITGCFGISNAIAVVRSTPSGGTLSGGPFSFCIDGLADTIAADAITLTGNMGVTNKWIIADTSGNILGTPPHFSNVNFDVAGVGTCLIYNISFDGETQGDTMNGHIDNITGCFGISNAIAVVRSTPSGGTLSGGPFSFCIDGLADTIATDAITLTGNMGVTNKWIIADTSGNILGTPPHFSNVNFDAAGVGTCLIYNISFDGEIQGDSMNGHIDNITGCFGISNAIEVVRSTPSGGTLSGGPFSFCIDGLADTIAADAITLTGNIGATNKWIIADTSGNILGTPPHFSNVNFDAAGVGTCLIYNISFDGEIQGDSMNGHIDNITGCFGISNAIAVVRSTPSGGTLSGGPFSFCIDGLADTIAADAITLTGNMGATNKWIIADTSGNILGTPPHFSNVNFDAAGVGTCLIYNISFDGEIQGDTMNGHIDNITGCFGISNAIAVVRTTPSGGTLSGGPFSFCIDGLADTIAADAITLTGNMGATNKWIIADTSGNILGTPPHFSNVNFDAAGVGTCLIYNISFDGEIQGDSMNGHIDNITGCFGISNAIAVVRTTPSGGTVSGGPFSFCIDGLADTIAADAITLTGNMGATNKWIIADTSGNILGAPPHFSNVNFDAAGVGTCLIYNISFDGEIQGDTMNGHIDNITGCFGISNAIAVVRSTPSGGTLSGGPFSFCIDGLADTIATDAITLTGNIGATNKWIIADTSGNILGTPPHFSNVNFDVAGVGTCLIYNISFDGEIQGDSMNGHIDNITGCFGISNAIAVVRSTPSGGTLSGGPFSFCIDGLTDTIAADAITLTGNMGATNKWIIADTSGNILGTPPHFSNVNFDVAGVGTCLIYNISFDGEIQGDTMNGHIDNITGCFGISNAIEVVRSTPSGGTLSGGPFSFCIDGLADTIAADAITLSGDIGATNKWIIADTSGNILGTPPHFSNVNFDAAGAGTCLIYNISFDGEIQGDTMNGHIDNITGCFGISNAIAVVRSTPSGGTLSGGPFSFCIDGLADTIATDAITLTGNMGATNKWIIADTSGNILGTPPHFSNVNFDVAGVGTCLIYNISFDGEIQGDSMNGHIDNITGCFGISNAIAVVRSTPSGGTLSGGSFSFCIDGLADTIATDAITLTGNMGATNKWIIADTSGNILGTPPHFSNVNFDAAGVGTCLIYNISFDGEIQGDSMNGHIDNITGCFGISNAIAVVRTTPSGGTLSGGPFSFCIDGLADTIAADAITLTGNIGATNKWIIADTSGNILGTPPHFSNVNFDAAGVGTCLIYNISFDGEIQGDTMNGHIDNITGCFGISNAIAVVRSQNNAVCPPTNVQGQLVLNEINGNGNVELKNIGNDSIDISSYFLCNFPEYLHLDTASIICGEKILAPGKFVTLNGSTLDYDSSDGELGLYSNSSFSDPMSIIDYVEWGNSGHQRSSVAINAGIWEQDSSVMSFASNSSLLYDGDGDRSSDWSEGSSSECAENNFSTPMPEKSKEFSFSISPNPLIDFASLKFKNETGTERGIMYIFDQTGSLRMEQVIAVKNGLENRLNLTHLESGIYFIKIFSSNKSYYSKFIVH